MKNPRKLFSAIESVQLPDSIRTTYGGRQINYVEHVSLPYVVWPDRRACHALNFYLMQMSHKWTGKTGISYASDFTQLIRYCYKNRKNFYEIDDSDIYALVDSLSKERDLDDENERRRNNNTIRRMLNGIFSFITWYEKHIYVGKNKLIGEQNSDSLIRAEVKSDRSGNSYWKHRYMPEEVSQESRMVIDFSVIEELELATEKLSNVANYSEPAIRPFTKNMDLFREMLEYQYERRRFMLFISTRTGLRPAEMHGLSMKDNARLKKTDIFIIPTVKRRKRNPLPREFPMRLKDSITILFYFSARARWEEVCKKNSENYIENDSMFISVEKGKFGNAVAKSALEKDFKRLCACTENQYVACLSQFRHRFITWEVLAHLKAWQVQTGKPATPDDYLTILERVSRRTDHKDPKSLLFYIDWALNVGGVWATIDHTTAKLHAADHLRVELQRLQHDLRRKDGGVMAAQQVIDWIDEKLAVIINDAKKAGLDA